MTRIVKLHSRFLGRQNLSFAEFQSLLEAFGYSLDRIKGSHHTYRHPVIGQRMQIQPNGKSAKDYQILQFRRIVEKHGLIIGPQE